MPDIRSDGLGLDGFESNGFLLVRAYRPSCPLGYSLRRISRSRVDRRTDPVFPRSQESSGIRQRLSFLRLLNCIRPHRKLVLVAATSASFAGKEIVRETQ